MSLIHSFYGDVAHYAAKVNKFPILSQEEEIELSKDFKENGNIASAHKLVTSHLRLVIKIAYTFRGYNVSITDAIAEGNLGLMRAVSGFDPSIGTRLSTYAMWWIKAAIQAYIIKCWSALKVSASALQKKLFFSLKKIKDLSGRYNGPTILSDSELGALSSVSYMEDSIGGGSDGDSSLTLGEIVSANDNNEDSILYGMDMSKNKDKLQLALSNLNSRDRDILVSRYLSSVPSTLCELSTKYAISKERVRQLEVRAISKIKEELSDYFA